MKRPNRIAALAAAFVIPFILSDADTAQAATKEDVIAAARAAGFSESYIQQGSNYLDNGTYTSEQYDKMIAEISNYAGRADDAIRDYLGESSVPDSAPAPDPTPAPAPDPAPSPETPSEPSQPVQNQQNQEASKPDSSSQVSSGNTEGNGSAAVQQESKPAKPDFSAMTDEEKTEYIANMSQAEKNQILKDLGRDKQLEIINSLIDASATLGMNVSLDGLTHDKIEYSIRNDKGDVVDIASMGVIVDDTGFDYTVLYLGAAGVILASACGLVFMSKLNKSKR